MTYAELAAAWLARAITSSYQLLTADCSGEETAPQYPCRDEQDALALKLLADGHITEEEYAFSYIEPGCVEHATVHFRVCQPFGFSRWLEISPSTGKVQRL
jgi:hypothetical protein